MRKALPTRTFGVEIEIIGLSQYAATRILQRAGINAVNEEDYDSGSNGSCDCPDCQANGDYNPDYEPSRPDIETDWIVKYDGSVYGNDHDGSCEVTTRILSGEEGLAELRKGVDALRAAGATVNETCGLHVHVGARDLTPRELVSVVKRYGRFEDQIDKFMHHRRRGDCNTYCQPMTSYATDADRWWRRRLELAGFNENVINVSAVQNWIGDRYHKVNVTALGKYGTIEFRHHNGAINSDTIVNWVTFLLHFVERARQIAKPGNRCRDSRVFTGLPKNVEAFYTRRMFHLADARSVTAWG